MATDTENTEHKQPEEMLHESEERLRAVITRVPTILWATDRQGVFTLCEGRGLKALGLLPGELVGQSVFDVFRDSPMALENVQRALSGEEVASGLMLRGVLLESHITPMRDETGEVCGITWGALDVTRRHHAETALSKAEARLHAVVTSAPVVLWAVDRNGTITLSEGKGLEAMGFKPGELVGQSVFELYADSPLILEMNRRALRGENVTFSHEANGVIFEARLLSLHGQDGEVIGVTGVATDVTELKRMESNEHDLRRFLQSTLNALSSHIAVLDEHGVIIAVNGAWRRFACENGACMDSVDVGSNYLAVCDAAAGTWSEQASDVACNMRDIIAGRKDYFCIEYPCHSPAEHRWFTVRITRFSGDGPIRIVVAHQDITQRKQAAEELKRTVTQLSEAQRLARLGSWAWNPATNHLTWSDELYRIYGFSPQEFKPTFDDFFARVHPDDRARVEEIRDTALRSNRPWEYDTRFIRPDGEERVLHVRGFVVVDEAKSLIRTYGTVFDVTERKQAEEERAELLRREQTARAEAEAAADRISRLQSVTAALVRAVTPQDVAAVLIKQGVAALGANTGSVFLLTESGTELELISTIGYPEETGHRWRRLPLDADIPLAEVVRTGESIWLDSHDTFISRYPGLSNIVSAPSDFGWAAIPLLVAGEAVGALGLRFSSLDTFHESDREFLNMLVQQCAQALERTRLFKRVQNKREQLQVLSRQLMAAQENERREIARELHDEIGQALTALRINTRSMQRLPEATSLTSLLDENLDIIATVLEQVRDLSLDLRPPMLDDLGLVAALRWHLDRQAKRAGFEAQFVSNTSLERQPAPLETACYRVAQEALTNIARHAGARHVRVEIHERAGRWDLLVRDDGVGFDVGAAFHGTTGGASFGLMGMQERVLLVGGHMDIESVPGQGTEVRAQFPLNMFSEAVERRIHPRNGTHGTDPTHSGR